MLTKPCPSIYDRYYSRQEFVHLTGNISLCNITIKKNQNKLKVVKVRSQDNYCWGEWVTVVFLPAAFIWNLFPSRFEWRRAVDTDTIQKLLFRTYAFYKRRQGNVFITYFGALFDSKSIMSVIFFYSLLFRDIWKDCAVFYLLLNDQSK